MSWIKVETNTATKAEVLRIAASLGANRHEALGLCVAFWAWADGETDDGFLAGCTPELVDAVIGRPGFCRAMIAAGWLLEDSGGLLVPFYARHQGKSAKARALAAERQARQRAKEPAGTA